VIIETHVHLSDAKYDADREEMLNRAEAAGVKKFINIGAKAAETRKVADFDRPGVYKSVGLHPHYAGEGTAAFYGELKGFLKNKKNIVAIGEIGLDYFKSTTPKDIQEKVFREFLGMAKDAGLPVVIHSREAHDDTLKVLREFKPEKRGIIHCFSGGMEAAKQFIGEGYLLGIGGVITFPNSGVLKQTVAQLPLEALVLETDAPWLAPQQVRGKRNEPAFLKYIVSVIAGLKGVTEREVEEMTSRNAEKLFGI
jgi:TatD DNase family protein